MPKTKHATTKENLAFGHRLVELLAKSGRARHGAGTYLANRYKVSTVTANDWLNGRFRPATDLARRIAEDHGASFDELYFGDKASNAKPAGYGVQEAPDGYAAGSIAFTEARGSCGGGSINWDDEARSPLIKEPGWFRRYKVKPENALAIWADGESMAEFIVDGDIVIFDKSKTRPRSGAIFLIEHPDGLKIKRIRRGIDGSWVLESDNLDKKRFPDEIIGPDQAELLKIHGEFIYRQGG
jgi:hypothetical protein